MARIVIIDDDPSILGLMEQVCRQMGHEVVGRGSGREGMAAVGEVRPELLLVDLKIPDMNGLEVIQECRREYPGTAVVMVTGFASVETAVEAMKLGAFDYLTKPFELDDLRRTVERALTQGREAVRAVVAEPAVVVAAGVGLPVPIVGESRAVQEIMRVAARVADNESPLLLEGEFGVGKQMVARAVHQMSRRGSAPFKVLQGSGLPAELLEQELFGSGGGRS
jgi:DNA-binding NtrC family response regulator